MNGRSSSRIPTDLLTRLIELKDTLAKRGAVVLRREKQRKPSYRIRVRAFIPELGYRKMLALKIPDAAAAMAVHQLLGQWRAEYRSNEVAKKQATNAARISRLREDRERRAMKKLVQFMAGGSSYNRRRMGKAWDDVYRQGVIPSTLWILSRQYLRPAELAGPGRNALQPLPKHQDWDPSNGLDLGPIVRQRARERQERIAREVAAVG